MKKATGFITLHRQIQDWEWYRHPHTAFLFIHLLLSANYVEGNFKGMIIKRGQLATSIPQLSTGTGLSIQQTKTALAHLRLTGEITDESNHQYRIITIVKYDQYQNLTVKTSNDQPTTNLQNDQRPTDKSFNDQHQYNNNNNDNNYNNKQGNNDNPPRPAKKDELQENGFEAFWAMYPRKVSKQDAVNAWKKIKPDVETVGAIIAGLSRWKGSDQWTRDDGRYIQYPATWLNKRMWEDDVQPARHQEPAKPVKPVKTVVAQQYEQRDYSSVDQQIQDDLDREMEEYMRREAYGR